MIDLRSDNVAGAAPEIVESLVRATTGTQPSYGADAWTDRLQTVFSDVFEHDCFVQPTLTGTATNALALALLTPAWGAVCCTDMAHIFDSECGAGEMFTGGAKIVPLPQTDGRLSAEVLERYLAKAARAGTAVAPPKALSLTEATERGTLYNLDQVAELSAVAKGHGLSVHMDGARFSNAVAALGCSPADVTWRAGVDVLSFGATKNGALAAEAVVVFDEAHAEALRYRARKAGQVLSKMRFVSAQLEAYLADDLWLNLARHANRMAARLADGLAATRGASLLYEVQINEIFASIDNRLGNALRANDVGVFDRGDGEIRMVTAFSNTPEQIDSVIAILHNA